MTAEQSPAQASVHALVLDCDGVITDTSAVWTSAFVSVAGTYGLALDQSQLDRLHGSAVGQAARTLSHLTCGSVPAQAIAAQIDEHLVSALNGARLTPMDGLLQLLAGLHGIVPMAVASNAPRRALQRVLADLGLTEYFAAVISADDVPRPKPAPDPYHAAAVALGADPARCVAVEDSEIGATSADAAGMRVIELAVTPWKTSPSTANGHTRRPPALRITSLTDSRVLPLILGTPCLTAPRESG
jgi:HAD superfamily hydrolase (TIGR01509 family)